MKRQYLSHWLCKIFTQNLTQNLQNIIAKCHCKIAFAFKLTKGALKVEKMKKWLDMLSVGFKFLSEFESFWNLPKLTRIGTLGYELKSKIDTFTNEYESKQTRINSAFEALDLVLRYKRENPKDFEEIFSALERFSQKRKSDRQIDEAIKSFFD